ncbi:alpha/beta hydrolase family protein [Tuwongella immobilis]|uniref:Peptidase S9 prolyl oligopeptidase catalytic domain-containing protein n=1 Tax=Tuwongella immobilis TaxID=692036 RepID=A0A6C2YP14_9BACT|nr:prolyl oligopeptidase family serine peptidase [Tuwongella immobilis]VIP03134.1 acetyl xylan esterase : Acetyl xylan esterase OS=Isosphaera pallida (strain ATCC 43644 / DSM 9630 / IS1B) GN=Isop_1803 PE=4 SV=1: Peptidase_S9 [Tuwongella immobilis]VTS03490.1 acetyl xylan esterase : Acetyl xylan esterase OS=Isosphaera pallida (strain ATCC 43644 / DSM 9630 / IS1B) GN=Isop_1803 PE=4 SV=1: Peptidase_S9 [Tuwongella immobilis]
MRPFICAMLGVAGLLFPNLGIAADAITTPGDPLIRNWLTARMQAMQSRYLDDATTLAEWQAKRPKLRLQFFEMLGLSPMPEKTPLKTTITGQQVYQGVRIENLHFQSFPGLYVTGNLYRPDTADKKLPTILYVCGHSNRGRDGNKTAFADHGLWFAKHGYVCLIVDTLQLGEVAGKHHGTYNLNRFWWHAAEYTPAGIEAWNGIRAIDYLVTRSEVDPERIGVTGISGGGATTVWIAAADDRVKVAVPVSGMSDLQSYVGNSIINGHCDCMFVNNPHRWEWTTILALVAPRPVLFANSDQDPIFPMDGNRRITARLRQLYEWYGKPDQFAEHVSPGGHDYRPDLRLAIFRFFEKHLANRSERIADDRWELPDAKSLRVFPDDSDLPKDAINHLADERFIPRGVLPNRAANVPFTTWRDDQVQRIFRESLRMLSDELPMAKREGDPVGSLLPMTLGEGMPFHIMQLHAGRPGTREGTLLILNEPDQILEMTRSWAKPYVDDAKVVAILPRGCDPTRWTRKNPPNTVERAHALLGTTVDAERLREIVGTLRWLQFQHGDAIRWRVVGQGHAGVLGGYAALRLPNIREVVIHDLPNSHRYGPYLPGILKIADISETMGLLAPRPLVLRGTIPPSVKRTTAIFQDAGAEQSLRQE